MRYMIALLIVNANIYTESYSAVLNGTVLEDTLFNYTLS